MGQPLEKGSVEMRSENMLKDWNEEQVGNDILKRAWLGQLMRDWIGKQGVLKKFSCQHRGMDYPRKMKTMEEPHEGETWWCKGKASKKYVEGGEHLVECEILVENGKGERTTPGLPLVILPSREAK